MHDPLFDTMKYSFRHGATTVSLRSFASELPADTGSGGIQYVVSDADAVDTPPRHTAWSSRSRSGVLERRVTHYLARRPGRYDELLRRDHDEQAGAHE